MKDKHLMEFAISSLSFSGKNKLMALWVSKERNIEMKSLITLFWLDDQWKKIYEEHRISKGFSGASVIAYEYIFDLVYKKHNPKS